MLDHRLGNLRFKLADLKPLIDHAKAAPDHQMGYGEEGPKRPALQLVKDSGCYLMSNGIPRLPDPKAKPGETRSLVVYAAGCHKDDEWIGGDDFVEVLGIEDFERLIAAGRKTVVIKLTEDQLEIIG